jgi:Periplasmic copper-binding protein (NosD)
MTRATRPLFGLLLLVGVLSVPGCGDDGHDGRSGGTGGGSGATLRVPGDHATIQAAVEAAGPGDLVLVEPGVYRESVDVETDELTIRGTDRNDVVLDGGFELDTGVRVVGADGVAVENMTARNYTSNGFFWTGVNGYRASYLTAYRIGAYGIYAFDATDGLIEHSYASGTPEGGIYVGQCFPCDTVVDDVLAEYNGLGYTGTNAGGDLYVVNSTFRNNRVGIMPNSGTYELCFPQRGAIVAGNDVHGNNQPDTPATRSAYRNMGTGILVYGGRDNVVARNLVYDHDGIGIGLLSRLEEDPNAPAPSRSDERPCRDKGLDLPVDPADIPTSLVWDASGNRVVGNVIADSRIADLAVATLGTDPAGLDNCFSGNRYGSSAPTGVESLSPCEGRGAGNWSAGALDLAAFHAEERPPGGDYSTTPVPAPQPDMPDAESAPARPATDGPPDVDVDAIDVPERP